MKNILTLSAIAAISLGWAGLAHAADAVLDDHVFTCPMAKAEWVQTTKEVQNPYMGSAMPACGIKIDTSSASPKMGGCCG